MPGSVKTVGALAPRAALPSTELLASFAGSDFAGQVARFGNDQAGEPPDTQIAAGPDSVVEATNAMLSVWSKTGAFISAADLNVMLGVPAGSGFSDPRVLFDAPSGRWFLTGLAFGTNSYLSILAVSTTSDPSLSWLVYYTPITDLPDQPKLGISADKVVISWNDFSGPTTFAGQETQVIQKSDLLAGNASIKVSFGPDATRYALVPAVEQSPTNTEFIAYNQHLLPGGGPNAVVGRIMGTPAANNVTWDQVVIPIAATSMPPSALQAGSTTKIQTNDDRFLSADWSQGTLWLAGDDACTPPGDTAARSCLRLLAVNANDTGASWAKELDFGAASAYAYFPAVATDPTGNLFVSFTGSGATLAPSAQAISMRVGGSSFTAVQVAQGRGPYDTTPCQGSNRWGDYSGAATDPSNPNDIWVASELAFSSTNSCLWGTAIARLTLAPPTVLTVSPSTGPLRGGTMVTITGTEYGLADTSVSFGGAAVASSNVTRDSSQRVRAVSPSNPGCGPVAVMVTTSKGTSSPATFTYFGWPCPASLVPASGGFRSRLLPPRVR